MTTLKASRCLWTNHRLTNFCLFALALTASIALGQQAEPATVSYEPFGKLQPLLDGKPLSDAEMFVEQKGGTFLLLSPDLDQPLKIISPTQKVERLDRAKVRRNKGGTVELLPDASAGAGESYKIIDGRVVFQLTPGQRLTLGPKPALIGSQPATAIVAHDRSYGYRLGLYQADSTTIAKLKKESREVEVKIFFGTWCGICGRILPGLMQVEKLLQGSKIRFEYIGLPNTEVDPVAEKYGLQKLPTAILSVGGKELTRKAATELEVAEQALLEMLGGG